MKRVAPILPVILSVSLLLTRPTAIDRLQSNGGFLSNKVDFQLLDKTDPDPTNGLFAAEDIPAGATLIIVPSNCFLYAGSDLSRSLCDTGSNLMKEYHLGKTSQFAPFVQYVFVTLRNTTNAHPPGRNKARTSCKLA